MDNQAAKVLEVQAVLNKVFLELTQVERLIYLRTCQNTVLILKKH